MIYKYTQEKERQKENHNGCLFFFVPGEKKNKENLNNHFVSKQPVFLNFSNSRLVIIMLCRHTRHDTEANVGF